MSAPHGRATLIPTRPTSAGNIERQIPLGKCSWTRISPHPLAFRLPRWTAGDGAQGRELALALAGFQPVRRQEFPPQLAAVNQRMRPTTVAR